MASYPLRGLGPAISRQQIERAADYALHSRVVGRAQFALNRTHVGARGVNSFARFASGESKGSLRFLKNLARACSRQSSQSLGATGGSACDDVVSPLPWIARYGRSCIR